MKSGRRIGLGMLLVPSAEIQQAKRKAAAALAKSSLGGVLAHQAARVAGSHDADEVWISKGLEATGKKRLDFL